jgi:hypothetical protein
MKHKFVLGQLGGVVADFVRYELEDGSEVVFEAAEGSLVSLRGGAPDVEDAGRLGDRLGHIAAAVDEMSKDLRERLAPEEVELSFGVKVSGSVGWWFFAKANGEATINVKLTWRTGELRTLAPKHEDTQSSR